jgi:VCBS repeat-containing protein
MNSANKPYYHKPKQRIMKAPLLLIVLTTLLMNSYGQFSKIQSVNSSAIDENWYEAAKKFIQHQEFSFKQNGNIIYTVNSAQRIGFEITDAGYKVLPIKYNEQESLNWKQELKLKSFSKGASLVLPGGNKNIKSNGTIFLEQYAGFTIEYSNDEKGLRQNFIINQKPNGTNNLEATIHVTGDLKANVENNELVLKNNNGIAQFYYRDLKVWDAQGQTLAAKMEMRNENTLAIVVNDKDAVYPVTIDPLNQTPAWTTSADGILPGLVGQLAVNAAYGFSVAGLGDVNGDGFDDIAVGAPAMVDLISGTGSLASVGAVFVYFGSSNGLPAVPTVKLQPTTLVAGALFGFSIAGGDVNNDGKNDILVGAPLDRVTLSIGGGNTANGTVGKAYVFNGATLTTNTTPLLILQLSGTGILENGVNLSVNALFGFSVAVTEDLNNDGKKDMIVGAPTYASVKVGLLGNRIADVQSGGAFIFLTKAANNSTTLVKLEPIKQNLLGLGLLTENINGLLFGYAVDGLGDYNGDGKADVVATAPAGIDANLISLLLNGRVLQGSAIVYYGTANSAGVNANPGAVLTATSGGLLSNLVGTVANVANLFGTSVKGVRSPNGSRNGNVLVGAPLGGAIVNVLNLQLKTGTVSVFKKKNGSPGGYVPPDQVLSSPRNSNNILELIRCNLLFGFSLDNVLDINCDGYSDIVVGEPVSSGVQLLNANVAGGAAYVYLGTASGGYQAGPAWTLTAYEDEFLGINATSLIGYSVAGAGKVKGSVYNLHVLVGTPSRTLDFGSGLLNLGNTFGTIFSLVIGNNGVGKAYVFDAKLCDHSPTAVNDNITTNEDAPVNGNASTNDIPSIDCENTWSLVGPNGGATHGTVTMNTDGTFTYTPQPNYNGPDTFTYKVCDCEGDCSTATVNVTVTPVDDAPVAVNDAVSTNEDTPVSGNASTNDTPSGDGGNTWTLVGPNGGTQHGSVIMNPNGTFTYTPGPNYNGTDVFTYQLCDADGDCSTATITVAIAPVDDVPIAANDNIITNEDVAVNGNAATNDIPSGDGGNTWALVGSNGGAAHGTVTMNPNGTYTYTPAPNYNGSDVFTYQLCDVDGDCSTATVTVTIVPVDDAPVAVNDVATTNEDSPVSGNVSTNDTPSADCENIWTLVGSNGGAQHGTVTLNPNGTYTYTPAPNYNGSDAFTYKVCDCDGDCSTATVTITINPVDDTPIAVNDAATTNEDTPVSGNAASNDTPSGDGGNVWSLVGSNGGALHGTVTMNPNGTYTYTPAANYNGADIFTYRVCDADGDCSTATITITINAVDDSPQAVNDVNSTSENVPVNGNASTNDIPSGDGGNVWSLVGTNGGALHGTVTMNANGTYTYTPAPNYNGSDVFNYRVCDADGDCSTAIVTITINPVDDEPTAVNDIVTTNEDTPLNGNAAANDDPSTDCENTWSLVGTNGGAQHGTVTMNPNGTFTYTPAPNYSGTDVFTYKVCDCEGDCSTATVTVTVNPVDDVPLAVNDVNTTNEDSPVNGNAASNDSPSGDGGNIWSLVGTNGGALHGTVTMNPNGTYTYTPAANYNGNDVFTYRLCDTDGDCSTATVTITINPVDDQPVAVNDAVTTNQGTSVNGNASSNDTPSGDGGNVWQLVGANGGATNGSVTMNPNGTFTYTPNAGYSGTDVFTYKLCDTDGDCSTATVTVTINSPCSGEQVPPTITCPGNQTLVLGLSCNAILPDYRNLAIVNDNCTAAGNITITQSPAAGTIVNGTGNLTITLTATDGMGNNASCTFSVNKVDQTPPTITCPSNKTIQLGSNCSAAMPDYRSQATVGDNCTPVASIIITQSPAPGTILSGAGTTTVTLTATDASGNNSSCTFTVTRVDQTSPTLTCQPNKTIGCNATVVFDNPTASDNCPGSTINIVSTTTTSSGTSTLHTRTWQAVDASGNLSATCSQTITQVACTSAHIFPTSTTCDTYKNGAQPLAQLCYSAAGKKVSNITPGVFFYYSYVTAPSASFCIDVVQTTSCSNFKLFSVQQGNQVSLYANNCTKVASGTEYSPGQARICITNAVPGAQYVISVKYDSKSVQGSTFAGDPPVCTYSFESRINGSPVANSQGSINLTPNCSASNRTGEELYYEAGAGKGEFNLFPNPATQFINLAFAHSITAQSSITLHDMTGKLLARFFQGTTEAGRSYRRKIDISNFAGGMYIIRLQHGELIETKKLVIVK